MSELPEGWSQCALREVGEIITGNTPSKSNSDNYGDEYPWVKPPDLSSDTPITGTAEHLSEQGAKQARLLPTGATLVSCIGILGKVGLAGTTLATNQQINSVVFDQSLVLPEYGFHYCKTLKNWLDENSSSTTVAIVNKGRFSEAPFALAPLNEQRRIVAKLEKLLSRVDAAQARLATIQRILKRFRQSVLVAACSGRLTAEWHEENSEVQPASKLLQDIKARKDDWLKAEIKSNNQEARRLKSKLDRHSYDVPANPAIPESWSWSSLLESCWLIVDCHNKTAPYESKGIPLVRTTNIKSGQLLTQDLKYVSQATYDYWSRRCPPEAGDILFTREAPMGESALIPEGSQLCMGQRLMLLRVFEDLTDAKYIAYALRDPYFLSRVEENSVGSGVKHLRVGDVESLTIPVPPLAEQQEIVRRVKALFKTADALEARYRRAKAHVDKLTQSILAKAFRGELVPQDPNDEPASLLLEKIRQTRSSDSQKLLATRKSKTKKAGRGYEDRTNK